MPKHTPFFKFDSSAWLGGSIQFTCLQCKGLFIDLCALYWDTGEPIKIDRKFKLRAGCDEGKLSELIETLSDLEVIVVNSSSVTVPFLDLLREERQKFLDNCARGGKKSRSVKGDSSDLQGTSSNKKEERREKNEENREEIINIQTPSSFDPNETFKPSANAYQVYYEIWENWKPFNPNDPKMKSSYFEACNVAGGEESVNLAAEYYIEFTVESGNKQYLVNPRKFLDERMFNVDYSKDLKELKRKQRSGK